MKNRKRRVREDPARYYDKRGVLKEIIDEPIVFSLHDELRDQILRGKRSRRLRNLSIKLDPVQIQALRKIATRRSVPYQTLIREWLAEGIKRELRLTG